MSEQALSTGAKEARRAYLRRWNKQHPERVKEYNRRFWEKKAAEEAREQAQQAPQEPNQGAG